MPDASLCFVTEELHPATRGGIGRLLDETVRKLSAAGVPVALVLDMPPDAVQSARRYAAEHYPAADIYSVGELLSDLAPDEAIPLRAFRFPRYWQSYRIA